jgi:thioredoxin 2
MAEPDLIRCAHCGTMNRVAEEKKRLGKAAVCGKCKSVLQSADDDPLIVTDSSFAEMVERSPIPVLLDMWAPWCGPCRMVGPVVDLLAKELSGRVRVGKMNVDENPLISARFGIQSIPALLIFRGGREVDRMVGVQPKEEILRHLERLVN